MVSRRIKRPKEGRGALPTNTTGVQADHKSTAGCKPEFLTHDTRDLCRVSSRLPLEGMFNTEQRDWQDGAIAAINTGLSIATNPFLHWPDFSSQADERNHTNKGDYIRGARAAVDARMLHWVRSDGQS